jgi:predicted FMN-binding regulatory protein PaiB
MYVNPHFAERELSQNRTLEDRDGIVDGLRRRGGDDDLAIAQTMTGSRS